MEHVQCFEQLEACGYFDSIYLVNFLRFFFVFIYISLLYRTIFACVFSVGCYDNRYPYRSVSSAQPVTIWTFNQSDTKRNVLVHVTFTKEKARKNYFEESIKRKWSEKRKKKIKRNKVGSIQCVQSKCTVPHRNVDIFVTSSLYIYDDIRENT